MTDRATGQPAALFAEPLHGAIVTAFVNLRPLGPELETQLAGPAGLRYIVTSSNGRVVQARSTDPEPWLGSSIAYTAFYRDGGVAERPDLSGTTRLFVAATVPGLGCMVAISDVFDALTSDRVYRRAIPFEHAVEHLRSERSRHFDPGLLDLFLGSLDELHASRATHPDPAPAL